MQTLAVVSVAGDLAAPTVRLVHDGPDFFQGKRRLRDQVAVFVGPRPMRHVDLDPVRTVLHLFARRLARLHRAVDDLNSLWDLDLRRITFQRIAAGRRNAARGGKDSWSRNIALVHRHLDSD